MAKATCSVDECGRPAPVAGMCWAHYERLRKHGTATYCPPSEAERFWAKVDKTETCWNWLGCKVTNGYGSFGGSGRRTVRAHRFAYELLVQAIPNGMQLDHRCHNRACVNPAHLRVVTAQQNNQNHSGARADNQSGVRGVYRTASGKWRARVMHQGKGYELGRFPTIEEAESAVVAKRNELHTHNDADRGLSVA